MKRFFVFLLLVVTLTFAAGCGENSNESPKHLRTTFESQAEIKIKDSSNKKDKKYKCKIFHSAEGTNNIIFSEPKSISGLTFVWENGKYEIAMSELSGEFTTETLPDNAFALCIIDALNSANKKENLKFEAKDSENMIYTGISDSGEYKIYVCHKGHIMQLTMENKGIEVDFKDI